MTSISLVIPCFNAASFLEAALQSALDQTRPVDEIIVVDDGSTDGSVKLAERTPGPIRVLRQARFGIAAARNAGIQASGGDIIAFLDADDLWPPDSLAARLAVWRTAPEIDYVFGAVASFDGRTGAAMGKPEAGRLAGALLLRRAAFEEIGLFAREFRTGETLDWIGRADLAGYRSAATGETVLRRRVHAANITRDAGALQADYLTVLRRNIMRRRQPPGGEVLPRSADTGKHASS